MRQFVLFIALLAAGPAAAAVVDTGANGFTVQYTLQVAVTPEQAFTALTQPGQWWSSDHTFSGAASNMTLEPKAGGCWCEKLAKGGSVQHMTVVFAAPGEMLVLRGGLGPFFDQAVDGAMTWTIKKAATGSELALTFRAGGYVKDGIGAWAMPVDGVLGEQVGRLKSLLDTGSAAKAAPKAPPKP